MFHIDTKNGIVTFMTLKSKFFSGYLVIIIALLLNGCATPAEHFTAVALAQGLAEETFTTPLFSHKIYQNQQVKQNTRPTLHVYLDGDGTPWEHDWPADDPTSRNPMILELLVQDNNPAILLGRPCYHGLSIQAACESSLWTSKRYAQIVVDSLVTALNSWLQQHPFRQVTLIGYSGGGTLAVLMANRIKNLQTVVTLSANLDVAAWSRALGFDNLTQSLNPIEQQQLQPAIQQWHLAGGEDDVVPAFVIKAYADTQKNAHYRLYQSFDHGCCWVKAWADILKLF
jgi:pimeloyl-ACP methyl ester carboxylesterase